MKTKEPKLIKFCLYFSMFLFIASLAAQIIITNKFVVKGTEMSTLLSEKESLEREVSLLQLKVAEVSSLTYVENKAFELGFVEYNQQISVINSSQFAALAEF